jgi:hypothetical protein
MHRQFAEQIRPDNVGAPAWFSQIAAIYTVQLVSGLVAPIAGLAGFG